ncbi:MAG: alkaline phosphatase D family protein [Sphingomonadaceae bacterium]
MQINRRGALGLIGAGAAAPAMGVAGAEPARASFRHGVASGDPTAKGAILWTRVTPADPAHSAAIRVTWHVAETAGGKPVESGIAQAQIARDFTVKVEPTKLQGGRDYYYHFEVAGVRSPEGRFRTLPVGKTDELHFAVVSCQHYSGGLFNVWEMISRRNRLDAVIHLGDYIYEYGRDGYGGDIGVKLNRLVEPPHETVTLADYRARHAQYRSDPDLQAAHARAAFICVWDDHETANDSWLEGAENHQPQTEGGWAARKAAAMQAYFEWLPIRDPKPGDPWEAINRSFEFGDLATLAMLETRLLARSEPAGSKGPPTDAASMAAILSERDRPDRELMGAPQKKWLREVLEGSVTAGKPWQIIGNQIVMARVPGPDVEKMMGAEKSAALMAGLTPDTRQMIGAAQAGYRAGLPFNMDSWDGYPAARERLYADFRSVSCRPVILSGDSHAFWANNLADAHGQPVAVEFGTTAISSPSIGDMLDGIPLGQLLEAGAPEVQFCDQKSKGCIFLTLTPTIASADYVAVSTIFTKEWTETPVANFRVKPRSPRLEHLG